MADRGILIVVSGFSGAGKGTIVRKLVSENEKISLSISMTTRNPREGEVNGRDYFFVTKEEFEEAINNGDMIEYASYVGNYYGTPKKYVNDMLMKGHDVILEIETQGAAQVKNRFPEAVTVFVTPPSADVLFNRLSARGTETEEVVLKRMKRAYEETAFIDGYDFLLVNDDLDTCVEELKNIIKASHHAPSSNGVFLKGIHKQLEKYNK